MGLEHALLSRQGEPRAASEGSGGWEGVLEPWNATMVDLFMGRRKDRMAITVCAAAGPLPGAGRPFEEVRRWPS